MRTWFIYSRDCRLIRYPRRFLSPNMRFMPYNETWFVMREDPWYFKVSKAIYTDRTAIKEQPSMRGCPLYLATIAKSSGHEHDQRLRVDRSQYSLGMRSHTDGNFDRQNQRPWPWKRASKAVSIATCMFPVLCIPNQGYPAKGSRTRKTILYRHYHDKRPPGRCFPNAHTRSSCPVNGHYARRVDI